MLIETVHVLSRTREPRRHWGSADLERFPASCCSSFASEIDPEIAPQQAAKVVESELSS